MKCEYVKSSYQSHWRGASQTSDLESGPEALPQPESIGDISLSEDPTPPLDSGLEGVTEGPTTYSPCTFESFSRHIETSFKATVPLSNNTDTIRDRWLYPYVEDSPAKFAMLEHSMEYLCRVLRTYPKMMSRREQLPPFIHPLQVSGDDLSLPLANCFTLSKMWEGSAEPAGALVEQTIKREMERLFNEVLA